MSTIEIHGTVAEGFEQVREEFRAVVEEEDGQSGAQLAAYLRGRQVVDLWSGPEVTGSTLTGLHSSSKGAAGLVVAMLLQDGVLDLDRPVAHYWPRFGTAGKDDITVRDVLVHRSGVIGVGGGFTVGELADERVIAERLVGQRPYFAPRTAHGYGGFVMYAIIGEVVRAVTGSTVQQLFEQRIRAPYGLDVYLGLPAELDHRYLPVLPWRATAEMEAAFTANSPNPHGIAGISYNLNARGFTAADVMALPNDAQLRRLGQASAGGVGSARGLARMYAAAVSGVDGGHRCCRSTPSRSSPKSILLAPIWCAVKRRTRSASRPRGCCTHSSVCMRSGTRDRQARTDSSIRTAVSPTDTPAAVPLSRSTHRRTRAWRRPCTARPPTTATRVPPDRTKLRPGVTP